MNSIIQYLLIQNQYLLQIISFKFGVFILSEGIYFDECADKKRKA